MEDSFGRAGPPKRPGDRGTWVIQQAVRLLNGDPEEYQHVLDVIRQDLDGVLSATQRWLHDTDLDPMLRWSMLHVLSDVAHPGTVTALHDQAARRLPERRKEPGVCEQAADVEELVNVMAIEGLGVLARDGVAEAVDALFDVLANQDRRSLRRPALAELVGTNPEYRDRAAALLGEEERYLLDLRVAREDEVRVVPDDRDPRRPPPRKVGDKPKLGRRDSRPPRHAPNDGGNR